MTLTCDTRLPPERSRTPLHFCFFREDRVLGPGWSSSPELRLPALWEEDVGSYWCQVQTATHSVVKTSLRVRVHVRSEWWGCSLAWGQRGGGWDTSSCASLLSRGSHWPSPKNVLVPHVTAVTDQCLGA